MNGAMTRLPQQGRLEERPLPRLLLELHRAGFGGALTLSRERTGKRFLFQHGCPVFAESNLASESLGVQLMDAGRLDRSDFNRVAAEIERRGCQEGTALLELGLLTPKELFVALKDQMRLRLIECFAWPHGTFIVDPNGDPGDDAQPFRLDPIAIAQAGIEAHWSGERVLRELGDRMESCAGPGPDFRVAAARLTVDSAVQDVLEALDGTRTLWKVAQTARSPRALGALWVLDAIGALAYADSATDESAPEIELAIRGDEDHEASEPHAAAPSASADASANPGTSGLEDEIGQKHAGLEDLDHYALLGVPPEATAPEIRKAYLKAAKAYHPDALARMNLSPQLREQANQVFAAIGKAHVVLADANARRDYDATLASGATDLDAERLAQAETLYRKAEILMRQGNFRGALEFLAPAVEIWPDEAVYQSTYGWALYKKMPSEPDEARDRLECALRLDPSDATTRFRLGVVLRDLNESAPEDNGTSLG